MALLSQQQINDSLQQLSEWSYTGEVIEKQYNLSDFVDAIDFVNDVAELAEDANHHPDITISYNKVTIVLWTHSEGGVTQKDIDLASEVEEAADDYL